jgi:hypothetical protein
VIAAVDLERNTDGRTRRHEISRIVFLKCKHVVPLWEVRLESQSGSQLMLLPVSL